MATDKRRIAFTDEEGVHLGAYYLPADSIDCEDGDFSGLIAMGTAVLRGRSFARSTLYWAILCDSDLSACNFEGVDLCGANLIRASLVDCDLRNANLGLDALGGATRLQGSDLTGARLDRCRLQGAKYDKHTRFPLGFDPQAAGMVETDPA